MQTDCELGYIKHQYANKTVVWNENNETIIMVHKTYRQMNSLRLTEFTETGLLPSRVAFDLVDSWRDTCNRQQIFQLLCREIAHTNGTRLARVIKLLHRTPCTSDVKWGKAFGLETRQ